MIKPVFSLLLGALIQLSEDPPAPGPLKILTFHGESVPGIFTLMELTWTLNQPDPETISYRLYRFTPEGEPLLVAQLPPKTHRYEDHVSAGYFFHRYRLEVWEGDSLREWKETEALVAHQGGFVGFRGEDVPHDGGKEIQLFWNWDMPGIEPQEVRIYRNQQGQNRWVLVGSVNKGATRYLDVGTQDGVPYNYLLRAYAPGKIFESQPVEGITSQASWMDMRKINLLIISLLIMGAVLYYILRAGKKEMFIRKIAGLEAIEEAVGRATEMGRPVLYVPGIQDLDDVQTLAGLTILGSVAKLTAQYETKLDVPVSRSLVMSNGREVVKEAYLSVGRPDIYHDDIVHYVTDEQFGYVAAVDGIMVREKPAACLYLGAFFAESLILAETGNSVGAIQVAGTAMPSQLPFFVAACDYTLIGEELFAASAYLSRDQQAIASLRGQDVGKAMALVAIVLGTLLVTAAQVSGSGFLRVLSDGFLRLFALNY